MSHKTMTEIRLDAIERRLSALESMLQEHGIYPLPFIEPSRSKTNITEKLGIGRPDLPLDHIDNGPFLPGCKPRKQPAPKSAEEWRTIREKAWETRRNGERKGT